MNRITQLGPTGMIALILCFFCFEFSGCAEKFGGSSTSSTIEAASTYFSSVEEVAVEVAYEEGAEPYIGSIENGPARGKDYWSILEENLQALFSTRKNTTIQSVPKDLSEMNHIDAKNKSSWTINELQTLAEQSRKLHSSATKASFFILFVRGYYSQDGVTQTNILGIHIGGTTIVAIFKDVIESSGTGVVAKFIEQSTVVHEMGHAVGLVNHGIPLTSDHEDSSNPAHCTNSDCVMYWLNEGPVDLFYFALRVMNSGDLIMFDSACLDDAQNYHP